MLNHQTITAQDLEQAAEQMNNAGLMGLSIHFRPTRVTACANINGFKIGVRGATLTETLHRLNGLLLNPTSPLTTHVSKGTVSLPLSGGVPAG